LNELVATRCDLGDVFVWDMRIFFCFGRALPEAALGVRGVDHDRTGPEYLYLDWYATANTDYVDYGTEDIQALYYGI